MPKPDAQKSPLRRISVQLSLRFAFIYAVLSGGMFFFAYWFTNNELQEQTQIRMVASLQSLALIYEEQGLDLLVTNIDALNRLSLEKERVYQLRDENGEHLAGQIISPDAELDARYLPKQSLDVSPPDSIDISGYWMFVGKVGPYTLVQGIGDNLTTEVIEGLSKTLIINYIIVILAGLVLGKVVGSRTENRIQQINDTLKRVSNGELAERIPASSGDSEELMRVTTSINTALGQLEALLESQKQITSDIAHDLRTPLQRLRQRLEILLISDQDNADLQMALGETENLIDTFKALLRIAQIESGVQQDHFVLLDFGAMVADMVEVFEPVAEAQGQSLLSDLPNDPVLLIGDPSLLQQLLSNLIENAIRHCPSGATIRVGLAPSDEGMTLCVSDDGPGIPEDEFPKVFRRFYRLEKSRSTDGHGLGLSLVQAISQLHGAEIVLSDNAPGLKVAVRLPPARDQSA